MIMDMLKFFIVFFSTNWGHWEGITGNGTFTSERGESSGSQSTELLRFFVAMLQLIFVNLTDLLYCFVATQGL